MGAVVAGVVAARILRATLEGERKNALEAEARAAAVRQMVETAELRDVLETESQDGAPTFKNILDAYREWNRASKANEASLLAFESELAVRFIDARALGLTAMAHAARSEVLTAEHVDAGIHQCRNLEGVLQKWLATGALPARAER